MKIALFMHKDKDLLPFANELLNSVTIDAAIALNLNTGSIEEGKNADILVLNLGHEANEQLPVHLILQEFPIDKIYINGINTQN